MLPWFDKLTMRAKPLKTHDLILSLSKDEAKISCFFSSLLVLSGRIRLLESVRLCGANVCARALGSPSLL